MSIGIMKQPRLSSRAVVVALLTAATVVAACSACSTGSTGGDQAAQQSPEAKQTPAIDHNFLRAQATAEAKHLAVYWLGRGFTAGDLTFDGPYEAGPGTDVENGEVDASYIVWLEGTPLQGATVSLFLTSYGADAWSHVENQYAQSHPGVTQETVTVVGKPARLISQSTSSRPLNALWVVVDMGDAIVVADAHSGGPATPGGPDYSPFVNNPDLLVQVMQNLRPYPQ